jgi:hypothetical protein
MTLVSNETLLFGVKLKKKEMKREREGRRGKRERKC